MIKITAFNKNTKKEYDSGELNYITFIDRDGFLVGKQSYIGIKVEMVCEGNEGNEDDEE